MRFLIALIATIASTTPALAQDPAAADTAPAAPIATAGADANSYEAGARDTLEVEVYGEEDLSGSYAVADDGTIDFPLLGKVAVVGLTTQAIDDEITRRLATNFLVNPQVKVRMAAFGSRPVQVLGSVAKPGTYYLSGQTRVLDILTTAGGIKEVGSIEVRVQRKAGGAEPEVINLERLVGYGEGNTLLYPGDVVYVPAGPLVYVSGMVEEPGPVPFKDGLTFAQAINKAGGPTKGANLRAMLLLRDGVQTKVNYKKILKGSLADPKLEPDDQITVKESAI